MAERVAKVPPDLQALNKRVVHRAMEVMGIRDGIKATAEQSTRSASISGRRANHGRARGGVKPALDARDSTFGDYRTATRDEA